MAETKEIADISGTGFKTSDGTDIIDYMVNTDASVEEIQNKIDSINYHLKSRDSVRFTIENIPVDVDSSFNIDLLSLEHDYSRTRAGDIVIGANGVAGIISKITSDDRIYFSNSVDILSSVRNATSDALNKYIPKEGYSGILNFRTQIGSLEVTDTGHTVSGFMEDKAQNYAYTILGDTVHLLNIGLEYIPDVCTITSSVSTEGSTIYPTGKGSIIVRPRIDYGTPPTNRSFIKLVKFNATGLITFADYNISPSNTTNTTWSFLDNYVPVTIQDKWLIIFWDGAHGYIYPLS